MKVILILLRRHWQVLLVALCMIHLVFALWDISEIEDELVDENNAPQSQICVLPKLNYMPESFRKYYERPVHFKCLPDYNWVEVSKGSIHILEQAKVKYGENNTLSCKVIPIIRIDEDTSELAYEEIIELEDTMLAQSDFMKVECRGRYKIYENLHATVVAKPDLKSRASYPKHSLGTDVIIFGFDSVSRMSWMRNLPKSHRYFTEEMKGVVMKGYNIVGDGTPQALMPILLGHSEIELPEVRKWMKGATQLDNLTWIWKDFKNAGYATQWGEDGVEYGTFNYRMKGFKDPPVDHYMRPFQLTVENELSRHPPMCLRNKSRFQYMLDYMKDLYHAYPNRPKVTFMFYSEYSHDEVSLLKVADNGLLDFLKMISTDISYSNTTVILMSDHGQRTIPEIRQHLQGKLEERLPYFSISLPKHINDKYPELKRNLQINSERLTSPFDVYETFKDILNFDIDAIKLPQKRKRGMSLFREIPRNRTCAHAHVAPHWCACLHWSAVSTYDNYAKAASLALVTKLNWLTNTIRDRCAELHVSKFIKVEMYYPDSKMIRFIKSIDKDGRIAEFGDKPEQGVNNIYQVTVLTLPNKGMYEATVTHKAHHHFEVDQISRINKYNNDPHCIINSHPDLRPYCYCTRPTLQVN